MENIPTRRALLFVAFAIFALLQTALAAGALKECPNGAAGISVPAVVEGQEGGLLFISAQIGPGDGRVYSSVDPIVGEMTQESQALAAREGLNGTIFSFEKCDVAFTIDDPGASSVDGPSAGLAMAVAVRAAAEKKTIREDVAITGTIEEDGRAGEVGGIIDKAQAASRDGIRILVTPGQQLAENILLRSLSEKYNFSAVQVANLDEAYRIATSKKGEEFESKFTLNYRGEPEGLKNRTMDEDERAFAAIARKINERLKNAVDAAPKGGQMDEYAKLYGQEIERNERIIAAGYPYTGANNAFLSLVNARFLTLPPQAMGLEDAKDEVRKCVAAVPFVPATKENFEWVAGYRVRVAWAQDKLREVEKAEPNFTSSEEKYAAARELYYATSWCVAAEEIAREAARKGGEIIDEKSLSSLVRERFDAEMKELNRSEFVDPDATWHMDMANSSLRAGENLAAIYDIAYSRAMQKNLLAQLDGGIGNATENKGNTYNPTSLWGKLYYGQGEYILQEKKSQGEGETYRLEVLARELDSTLAEVAKKMTTSTALAYENHTSVEKRENATAVSPACTQALSDEKQKAFGLPDLLAASLMMVALAGISAELFSAKPVRKV